MDRKKTYASGIMEDRPDNLFARKMKTYNCTRCAEYSMILMELVGDKSFSGAKEYDKWAERDIYHYKYEEAVGYVGDPPHVPLPKPGTHEGNGKPKGLFAFTLTFSPTDGKNEYDLKHAAERILTQSTCPVKRYIWYLEKREDGSHPHIHGVYETKSGGRIFKKVFKRYWDIWGEPKGQPKGGFRGGYHKPVAFDIAYKEYIEKDEGEHNTFGDWTDIGQLN